MMRTKLLALAGALILVSALGVACNKKNEGIANQKQIEAQLQMAGLNNASLHLDKNTRVARLEGSVKNDQEKAHAERIVRETAPSYTIQDHLSVESTSASVGNESGPDIAQTATK
jgi:hypothetical protein